MLHEFKCKDDPEANDRVPRPGDQRFTLTFPLETGDELKVHFGRESLNHFTSFVSNLMVDEAAERERTI